LAYAVSKSGSDWSQISVRDVSTKQDLTDKLDWVKFSSIAWTKDASGFFYSRYPPPKSLANKDGADKGTEVDAASGHMLYFHKLNTPQSDDVLICAPTCKDEHEWLFGAEVTDCGRWLVISVANGCDPVNQVWLLDLQSQNPLNTSKFDIVKLVDNFAAGYDYISNEGSVFYFKTNLEAPRYKLISVNIETGARATLIEEHAVDVLNFVVMIGGDKPVVFIFWFL
jgi:prolyl oligopeptidase